MKDINQNIIYALEDVWFNLEKYYKLEQGGVIHELIESIITEVKNDKSYNMNIEVKHSNCEYELFINNVKVDFWSDNGQNSINKTNEEMIKNAINEKFDNVFELQNYLIEHHTIKPMIMTMKELEEKLGVENITKDQLIKIKEMADEIMSERLN